MTLKERYLALEEEVQSFRLRRGLPFPITLIAVSKGATVDQIKEVSLAGCSDFGESRVPDALEKKSLLDPSLRWHFIGNLQTKKIPKVIGSFALIHSVDSLELLKAINEKSKTAGVVTHVLLQANTSGESTKRGASPAEWEKDWPEIEPLKNVLIEGMMTMAPLVEEPEIIRKSFSELRLLRDRLLKKKYSHTPLYHLSMGMSHDWRIALEEGATLLRIGSAIFEK